MSTSSKHQKKIAKTFIKLVTQFDFEDISISKLMKKVGMRRQSFYDYFKDKNDLILWIFQQKSHEINAFLDTQDWQEVIFQLITYLENHRTFYHQVFNQKKLIQTFNQNIAELIIKIHELENIKTQANSHNNKDTKKSLTPFVPFYAHGVTQVVKEWLVKNCNIPIEQFARQICVFIYQSTLILPLEVREMIQLDEKE